MKYQIYLNKEASQFIEKMAIESNKKQATVIKTLVESFVKLSKPLEDTILKEVKNYGNKGEKQ